MHNHYHLLVSIGGGGLSAGMHDLNHSHAITFNARHERINHLFGKRYWSRHLTDDAALVAAARYIVQNPVRAGIATLDGYEWSSYRATVGLEFAHMALSADELLAFFGQTPEAGVREYSSFCRGTPNPAEVA